MVYTKLFQLDNTSQRDTEYTSLVKLNRVQTNNQSDNPCKNLVLDIPVYWNMFQRDTLYTKLNQSLGYMFPLDKVYTTTSLQCPSTFRRDKEYIKMNPVSMNMFQLDRVYMKLWDFYNRLNLVLLCYNMGMLYFPLLN